MWWGADCEVLEPAELRLTRSQRRYARSFVLRKRSQGFDLPLRTSEPATAKVKRYVVIGAHARTRVVRAAPRRRSFECLPE